MTRKAVIALAAVFSLLLVSGARAEVGWILDIMPGTILANTALDNFEARGDGKVEEMSLVSSLPSVAGGVRWDHPSGYVDLKGGAGALLNTRLRAYTLYGLLEGYWEVKRSFMMGPHVGVAYYGDPEWWGDADLQMDSTTGWMGGLSFIFGDRVSYVLSADYYDFSFDVTGAKSGWTYSDDTIDMSGLAVQFGLRLQF